MPVTPPKGGYTYPYQSNVDFGTVHDEVVYWLNNNANPYTGNPNGGEMGNDFGMPVGTPVYAVTDGVVDVNPGYYGGGGVISVKQNSKRIWYYQHMDFVYPYTAGDEVKAGQLLGYSGGQQKGGLHPVTCCSNFDHIEVGVNAPKQWGSALWGNDGVLPSVDSAIYLRLISITPSLGNIPTGGSTTGTGNLPPPPPQGNPPSPTGNHCYSFLGQQICLPNWAYNWITEPWREIKLVFGVILILVAVALVIIPPIAGPGLQVAGVATGQPEIVAAGAAISQARRQKPIASVSATKISRQELDAATEARSLKAPPTKPLEPEPAPITKPVAQYAAAGPSQPYRPIQTVDPFAPGLGMYKQRGVNAGLPSSSPAAKPQRGPATGLTALSGQGETYTLGARRTMSRKPIPDSEVLRAITDIQRRAKEDEANVQATRQYQQSSFADALKAVTGTTAPASRVPGTEQSLEGSIADIVVLRQLLSREADPQTRANLERDIKTIQARIDRQQKGK